MSAQQAGHDRFVPGHMLKRDLRDHVTVTFVEKVAVVGAMLHDETGHVDFLPAHGVMKMASSHR